MQPGDVIHYFRMMEGDTRLNVWHSAILVAIISMGLTQGRSKAIKVSRSKIMAKSHVRTLPTYHKYFKELQDLGYIGYRPSYHPGVRSEIDMKQPIE